MRWLYVALMVLLSCVGDVLIIGGFRTKPVVLWRIVMGWLACFGALGFFTISCRTVSLLELSVYYDAGTSLALAGYSRFVLKEDMSWWSY